MKACDAILRIVSFQEEIEEKRKKEKLIDVLCVSTLIDMKNFKHSVLSCLGSFRSEWNLMNAIRQV